MNVIQFIYQSIYRKIMKITLTEQDFIFEYRKYAPDHYSEAGLKAMYDNYSQYEFETEFDPVSFSLEWDEFTLKEALENYNIESLEELEQETHVIDLENGFYLIQVF